MKLAALIFSILALTISMTTLVKLIHEDLDLDREYARNIQDRLKKMQADRNEGNKALTK